MVELVGDLASASASARFRTPSGPQSENLEPSGPISTGFSEVSGTIGAQSSYSDEQCHLNKCFGQPQVPIWSRVGTYLEPSGLILEPTGTLFADNCSICKH